MKKQIQLFLMIATLIGASIASAGPRPDGQGLATAVRTKNAADVNTILSTLKISGVDGTRLIDAIGKTISAQHGEKMIDLAATKKSDATVVSTCQAFFTAAIQMNQSSSSSTGSGMMSRGKNSADATLTQDSFDNMVSMAISSMDGTRGNQSINLAGLSQIAAEYGRNAGNPVVLDATIRPMIDANLASQGKEPLPADANPREEIKGCK